MNVSVLQEVHINYAEAGYDNVKWSARIDVRDTLSRHACMIFGPVLRRNYLY